MNSHGNTLSPIFFYHFYAQTNIPIKAAAEEVGNHKSELKDPSKGIKLEIGSPIIVVEAPKYLKTADSVPCLRANPGIVSRKPKDVWAVRLNIGTYLIDGKYFKPLEVDE
nr:chlororespiratory reduction 42 [Ipomoea batatas]